MFEVSLRKLVQFKTANKYKIKINFFTYLLKLCSGFDIHSAFLSEEFIVLYKGEVILPPLKELRD